MADIVATTEPICFPKEKGKLTGKNKVVHWGDPHENLNGKHLKDWKGKYVLFQGDGFEIEDCEASLCFELASIDLSQVDTGWFEFQVEYDLSQWNNTATCVQSGSSGIEARLAFFVTSPYTNEQGEPESRARIQIDELCIDQLSVGIIPVNHDFSLRIYPNPNHGEFNLELSDQATPETTIRILSLTGQILFLKKAEIGQLIQRLELSHIPDGMYFVQIISEGRLMSVNKFVKQ
jgi:hypothetical protein